MRIKLQIQNGVLKDGHYSSYYESKNKESEFNYLNSNLNGHYCEYYDEIPERKKKESNYING